MIPKIIHQTWRDHNLPGPKHWPESWKIQNPNWEYRLWTDDDLLTLVRTHYPDLEELYQSYPNPVQRADLGRYLVLDHCGGVYADLDTECYGALDAIAHEDRIILAQEPTEHFHHAQSLGLGYFLFNGLMVSPKGHPFWQHLFATLKKCKNALDRVLESTGPLALSGAYASYRKPEQIAVQSCHIFTPLTSDGRASHAPMSGDYGHLRIANHFWGSSWFKTAKQPKSQGLKLAFWKMRYRLTRGPFMTREDARNAVDYSVLHQPVPTHQANVAVLIPVRDASAFLDRCFALLLALDYPHQKIKLVFCEGDSKDDTVAKLTSLADKHRAAFRDIQIVHQSNGFAISRDNRWKTKLQKARRTSLARVRNHLIENGLTKEDDWALWIDVDVSDYDPGTLKRLLEEREKVVTPDCVREWDGRSFDTNAFNDDDEKRNHRYFRRVRKGLYTPPANHRARRHLHTLRFLERVPLSSVGGTMLLVHAAVHNAGVRFPEIPYDDLLETEGFGRMCRDLGVQPIGLPNVQIRHVSS